MAFNFPEGAKFYFSQTFGTAQTVSAITNADPAVCTSTGHTLIDDDEVLLTSGWEDATDTVFKVDQLSSSTFSLLEFNTTDTTWYSPGGGVGTAQKITGWVEIPQVLTISTSGGDPRYTEVNLLSRRNGLSIPTGFNPAQVDLTLAHDPANLNYKQMLQVTRSLKKVAFKLLLGGGSTSYGYGYMAVSETPQMNSNQVNQVSASFTMLGRTISYA